MGRRKFSIKKLGSKYLLLVPAVAIAGFAVWFAYDSYQNAESSYESAESSLEESSSPEKVNQQTASEDKTQSSTENKNQAAPAPKPPAPPPPQATDPHAIVRPSIANCSSSTFQAYFYKTGGTDGYASTGQSLPNDAQFKQVYFPDSYLNPPVNPITVSCVKDASDNFVDGWVSMGVWRGNTYLKMEDLTLNPPL